MSDRARDNNVEKVEDSTFRKCKDSHEFGFESRRFECRHEPESSEVIQLEGLLRQSMPYRHLSYLITNDEYRRSGYDYYVGEKISAINPIYSKSRYFQKVNEDE